MIQLTVKQRITNILTQAFNPVKLTVTDNSELHKGHIGAKPGGETHFKVEIIANAFVNKSRIESHRMIYNLLSEELKEQIHALEIKASTTI